MGTEDEFVFRQAGLLQNFRRVAMRKEIVGTKVFIHFDKVKVAAGIFASPGDAGLAIADHGLRGREQTGLRQRTQGENDAGGIAAGIGNELCVANLTGIEFRQPIYGVAEMRGVRSRQFVPR